MKVCKCVEGWRSMLRGVEVYKSVQKCAKVCVLKMCESVGINCKLVCVIVCKNLFV